MSRNVHAGLSVFLDFDTVVSSEHVGAYLLDRLAPGRWRVEVAEPVQQGWVGGRMVNEQQWRLLPRNRTLLMAVASEVPVDPAFGSLVEELRAVDAEITVVSDGFGFYVGRACAPFDVRVLANAVDFRQGALEYPYLDRCCSCLTCGMCKQAPIKEAKERGRTTVFAGGAASDRKAALLADVLYARGTLAEWCSSFGVPFRALDSLTRIGDVTREVTTA